MVQNQTLERLTASDMFLLLWEEYGWATDIGGLAVLDGTVLLDGQGRVRVEQVRRRLEPKLALVPRFRQILRRPGLGLGWPLWVDAPWFDIADHVRVHQVSAPGGDADLLQACQQLARRRLDPDLPLWELWLLAGLPQQRLGAFLRLHHAVADGAAAVAAFGALLDLTPGRPEPPVVPGWAPRPAPTAGDLLADNLTRRGRQLAGGWSGLTHPARTWTMARRTLPAWKEVLADRPAPSTSLNRPVGPGRRLAVVRGRLEPARQAAHADGATVNDVILAAVTTGLRDLLDGRGETTAGLVQRAMVTISLHAEHGEPPGQARGNKPGWMMIGLPLHEPDPVRRLELIAAQTAAGKNHTRPEAGTGIFRFIAGQRVWYRFFPHQRAVNLVVSNAAGPPVSLYLADAPILELFPMMPTMGNLTLVVAALSYHGQLNITAAADPAACPDLDTFTAGVRRALDELCPPGEETVPPSGQPDHGTRSTTASTTGSAFGPARAPNAQRAEPTAGGMR